jgi:hypothetical protein
MKTMLLCLIVPAVFGFAQCAKAADVAHAQPITALQSAYCHAYAEHEYSSGREYEGAQEECEVQFLAVGVQWDDPSLMSNMVELALRAESTESLDAVLTSPLPRAEAMRLATELGRDHIERVGAGWLPETAGEQAADDQGAR